MTSSFGSLRGSVGPSRSRSIGPEKRQTPGDPSQTFERIATRAGVPRIPLHDTHTHATLLIKAQVHVKVVSERLGHGNPAFTIDTYQHVPPGLHADAAREFEELIAPAASSGIGR